MKVLNYSSILWQPIDVYGGMGGPMVAGGGDGHEVSLSLAGLVTP